MTHFVDYGKLIKDSLESQIKTVINYRGVWDDIQIFSTSIDYGRQTGKTTSVENYLRELGGVKVYVAHNQISADKMSIADCYRFSKRSDIDHFFRGMNIETNMVTIVFDECDFRTTEMFNIAKTLEICMRSNNTALKFIHVVRLGM